jgi:hypothetical protein
MRRLVGVLLFFPLLLIVAWGCKKTPVPQGSNTNSKASASKGDTLRPALDLLRQGTEVGHYRDALNVINAHLTKDAAKQVAALTPEEIENLRQLYHVDDREIADIGATLFRPEDAYYLQSACLFRDVAGRLLEAPEAPLDQARIAFDWVIRGIQLHEQGDENLPPLFVLRRGFGSALDRALAFLALARQFQLEGCLLAPPGAHDPAGPLLVGILAPEAQKASLYLFDPRLGMPIPGPGNKGIATLDEARADPGLLKVSGLSPDVVSKLEGYQAGPIEAMAPRMRYLQGLAQSQDKLVLFQDSAGAGRELAKATGRPVGVWPSDPKRPSPARALRLFLSPEDGGIDKTSRHQRFQHQRLPEHWLLQQFQAMRLLNNQEVPKEARDILWRKAMELFTLFALQPKEFFLHGQLPDTLKRVDRMRNVLDSEEAARPLEDEDFKNMLNDWRARLSAAYVSFLVRNDPAGKAKVEALWVEDQYLLNLVSVDSEFPLQKFEKKFLTVLLLSACREPLGQEVNYLVASCRHEKAAQLQAGLQAWSAAGKDAAKIQEDAEPAWKNARSEWSRYVERYQLTPATFRTRWATIVQNWDRLDRETAVSLIEQLHRDLHISLQARLRLAEAQQHLKASNSSLPSLLSDLEALQASNVAKEMNECVDKARPTPPLANRLELLARDWGPQGNLRWLTEAARQRAGSGK